MVQLDLPCCTFDENVSEEFQNFLEEVDALAIPDPDKVLLKFIFNEYSEFESFLKRIELLNKEVVSDEKFYTIYMNGFIINTLLITLCKPQYMVILLLESKRLEENLHDLCNKINFVYEKIHTLSADDSHCTCIVALLYAYQ